MASIQTSNQTSIIQGQAGIAGGTGLDAVNAPRVTLATNISLPAGTNAIGKLAANSGVDIGDVDILSIAAGDNNIGNVDIVTMPATAADGAVGLPTTTVVISGYDGANVQTFKTDAAGELQVDVLTLPAIPAGSNNIGDVDIVTLPSGNLGQQLMAASLSTVPASNITDATYIGDIKFGEGLPANSGIDVGDVTINNAAGAGAVNVQDGGNSITVDGATLTAIQAAVEIIDNIVAGAEAQVDIITSALPTGASTAANQTTQIGDLDALNSLAGAAVTVPIQITKTVAAVAIPEVLAVDGTFFRNATLIGKKAARTANAGIVYLGIGITNDTQALAINPDEVITIAAPPGEKFDLNDWGLDVLNAGDGVIIIYS